MSEDFTKDTVSSELQLRHTIKLPPDEINGVAWSPDGSMLASASSDNTVRLWDTNSGTLRQVFTGHNASVRSLAWSPDGSALASAGNDKTIFLWDIDTSKFHYKLEGHRDSITSLAWSLDGRQLASAGNDGTVLLWNIKTSKISLTLKKHSASILSIAWSPDKQLLASGADDGSIRLWDIETGKSQRTLGQRKDSVRSVAWSPDGHTLASGSNDGTISLWNITTGQCIRTLEKHRDWIRSVAWSPDGQLLASGADDGSIRLWDIETGKSQRTLGQRKDSVRSVAWSPDGHTLASGSNDGFIYLWDVESNEPRYTLGKLNYRISAAAWSPDGSLLASGSNDGSIRLWEGNTGNLRFLLKGTHNSVSSLAWSPDGRALASAGNDKTILLWNIRTGKLSRTLRKSLDKKHGTDINAIFWAPQGNKLASVANDGVILIWNTQTGQVLRALENRQGIISSLDLSLAEIVNSIAWSQDGNTLACTGSSKVLRLWNTETGKVRFDLKEQRQDSYLLDTYLWRVSGHRHAKSRHFDWKEWAVDVEHLKDLPASSQRSQTKRKRNFISQIEDDLKQLVSDKTNKLLNIPKDRSLGDIEAILPIHTVEAATRRGALDDTKRVKHLELIGANRIWTNRIAWAPDGNEIALGLDDGTIQLWNTTTRELRQTLEGHSASITDVIWSPDGHILASRSNDNSIRIWRCDTWDTVKILDGSAPKYSNFGISFYAVEQTLSTLEEFTIKVQSWELDTKQLLTETPTVVSVRYTSAKIVFVGESNVGKSCLALRIAQNNYEEQGTTHGMRIWSLSPEQLSPDVATPAREKRDVILWDMGGQDEYRLIHQLFLHDTTVALVLLDPTRGRTAFEEVEGWNLRLEKQLQGRKTVKLLVGTKLDHGDATIDRIGLERLIRDCGFVGYYPTSAKNGQGIPELRGAIARAINWQALTKTSRPVLFQRIRDEIERKRKDGDVVLLYSDLENQIHSKDPSQFDVKSINTVVEQLALQGMITGTRLASGEPVLLLQISEIERYAGSLIIAARNNPRGVPAIEEQVVTSAKISFPGINEEERLHPFQERIVLECVVQLLLEHGLCLKHEGLLIFPSLFQPIEKGSAQSIPHSVSLYYDFSGAIDNIYSALVVRLAISEQFGRVRLWEDRAEFETAGEGICGLRKVGHRTGLAHLDLFFSTQTPIDVRNLFTVFVEEHLQKEGVSITEVLEVKCPCGYRFQETSLRKRLAEGYADIICPECETRSRISEGAKKARVDSPEVEAKLLALKTIINRKNQENVIAIKIAFDETPHKDKAMEPIRILHLSDLHLNSDDDRLTKLQPLIKDLEDRKSGLGVDQLDYLVVSGDLTNRGLAEEFEQAYQLISGIIKRFRLTAARCIIVPGNHDLSWDQEVYTWKQHRLIDVKSLRDGSYVAQGNGFLIRNEKDYAKRFENFAKFYHSLTQQEYPLNVEEQCIPILFEDTKIQFLAMNSAWEIDEFFPARSGINDSALSRGLIKADEQIKKAQEEKQLSKNSLLLRIAVWHHPSTGNEKINNDAFLERLRQEDIHLCLHGHVHEDRADIVGYPDLTRRIHIIGAGSFGAPTSARPESVPRLYNLLEVARDSSRIRVYTRRMRKDGGAWGAWAVWPGQNAHELRSYYDIDSLTFGQFN